MKFKKMIAVVLALALILCCTACSGNEPVSEEKKEPVQNIESAEPTQQPTAEPVKDVEPTEAVPTAETVQPTEAVPTDEPVKQEEPEEKFVPECIYENGVYLNEEGIFCNADGSVVDLNGMEIVIADWFTKETDEPTSALEEATEEYLNEIQSTYNFKIRREKISGRGSYYDNVAAFLNDGGDENYVFYVESQNLMEYMSKGLFFDLSQLDVLDFSEKYGDRAKWNPAVKEQTTLGTAVYGMNPEEPEPCAGVFWNKRLFEEAGIDPELPYDLQAQNKWTWEEFEKLCVLYMEKSGSDGKTAERPMASFVGDLMSAAIASNGAQLVDKDEEGRFYLASDSEEFKEAYDWAKNIRQNYDIALGGNEEDVFLGAAALFLNGKAAMVVSEEYMAETFNSEMEDDCGFVMFPHGTNVEELTGYSSMGNFVIPSCYDKDRAWKIAFAYNLYTEPVPCFCEDDWMEFYYPLFRDERAVTETLQLMRIHQEPLLYVLIPGINTDNEYYLNVDSETAVERYESRKEEYQSYIDAALN